MDSCTFQRFGFGRLAWDPFLSAEAVTREWVELTWGCDGNFQAEAAGAHKKTTRTETATKAAAVETAAATTTSEAAAADAVEAIAAMLLSSWEAYENYTSPLGLGAVVDNCRNNPG